MGVGAKVKLTRTVSVAVILGMAALANAADSGDSVSAMRALAARLSRAQMAGAVMPSSALASGSGFARAYGGPKSDEGFFIGQAGGNYVFEGTTDSFGLGMFSPWLTELDGNGNLILQQVWGTAQTLAGVVNPTPDGGYFVNLSSETAPLQLIKLNSSFASVWQKQYGSGGEGLTSAVVLKDNSFLIEGSAVQISGMGYTTVDTVIKTDSSGNIVWQKKFSSSGSITLAFGQLTDGSFIGVGTIAAMSNPGNPDILVVKLDSSGNITWQKSYGGPAEDFAYSALQISGGYLISGLTTSFGAGKTDVWLLQLDGSGNVAKQETIGGAGNDEAFIQAVTGGYLLSGLTDSAGAGGTDGWLVFLDSNLNVTSSKTYGGPGDESLYAMPDSAGGFLLQGTTKSFGGGGEDIWVIKTDASGTPQWQNAYGGPADESGGVVRISGGGLLLSGSTESWGAGNTDMLAALLDANGQLAGGLGASADTWDTTEPTVVGCGLVHPTSVTPANFSPTVTPTSVTPATTTIAVANGTITTSTISLSPTTTNATVTDICGATGTLTATASANTTSGTAPLSVNFTGSAAGGTSPYTYDWNFGDGSTDSTQQNPNHVYTSAGSYNVVFKVTDAKAATATDSHLDIAVSAGTCTLTCQATVPTTGTVGVAVSLTSSASASNCGGSVSYLWSFGDGQTSTAQNPTHTYAQAQTYAWTLSVTAGTGHCSKSGNITISAAQQQYSYLIAAQAHSQGANNTQWRSNIAGVNRNSVTAHLTLTYYPYDGSAAVAKTASLAPGTTTEWQDILVGLFGQSGSPKGSIGVTSDQPVVLISRTFNQAANGTFGQSYPAITDAETFTSGQVGVLPMCKKNSGFRTNIGILNVGSASVTALVKLFSASGTQVGSSKTLTAAASRYIQQDDIFVNVGAGNQDIAYATVEVQTAGGKIWAFASVIDAITGDPTTVPVHIGVTSGPYFIAAQAHLQGANNTQWRSNIAGVNRNSVTAHLTLTYYPYDGSAAVVKTASLAPGTTTEWQDILVGLFGQSGSPKGSVGVTSDQPIFLISRTFNQAANGTLGQSYPAIVASRTFTSGQVGVVPMCIKNSGFRTNIGILNVGSASVTALVKLFSASGTQVGSSKTLTAAASRYIQQDDIFVNVGAGNQDIAYATVEVQTAGGKIWAFASVIDAITGDPTTVEAIVQ